MAVKLQQFGCGHRPLATAGPCIAVFFVLPNGRRRAVGRVCAGCAATWGPRGFIQFASWHSNAAIAGQPELGPVQITFVGTEQFYSATERADLLAGCEANLRISAEQNERLNLRELGESPTSAEIMRLITFAV